MDNRKVLLSIKDLVVKFRVRGRILTAIRGISLDIYENESIAIVGESGSGKSVFTKTFAGMLDQNGYIDNGSIVFADEELADTRVKLQNLKKDLIRTHKLLNDYSKLELGAQTHREINRLLDEKKAKMSLTAEEAAEFDKQIEELRFNKTEAYNKKMTLDASKDKEQINELSAQISSCERKIKALEAERKRKEAECKSATLANKEYLSALDSKLSELKAKYAKEIQGEITPETVSRNEIIAKEIYLAVGRFTKSKRISAINKLHKVIREAMRIGVDLSDWEQRAAVLEQVVFPVRYLDETEDELHGHSVLNLTKIKYANDWTQIRGTKIATVFQDPMTSLNPIITIGNQITSIILKHQHCSEAEARRRAITLMQKVGIPNAESRFNDYPFQYSGGMRQRIVIAIALSCQPKILICDEPTTALDVTIQAQILTLIKDLQKEFGYTIVFITHDLGVVANIADRVAVLYAGQIVELGTVEDVFYDPRHPYTWALLSSLPQLAQRNTKLYSITGTPPSLYNRIIGDPFAPRNPYAMKVDSLKEAPMFSVSETHMAKTWLLDPRAPKIQKPDIICDIHEKLMKAFNIDSQGGETDEVV